MDTDWNPGKVFLTVVGCIIAIILISVGIWYLGWGMYGYSVNRNNQIIQHSLPMQNTDIAQARQLEDALRVATGQQQQSLVTEFCNLFVNINPDSVPTDIQNVHVQYCGTSPFQSIAPQPTK